MTIRVRILSRGGLLAFSLVVTMYEIYSFHHQSVYREGEDRFLVLIARMSECSPH
jgi:hypothetical protein